MALTRRQSEILAFIDMMRTVSTVEHFNIVQLYEAEKTGPFCWLSMEFVEGESLGQVIRRIGAAAIVLRYSNADVKLLGRYDTPGEARGVQVVGGIAYVADGSNGLEILNVSNPVAISRLGGSGTGDPALGLA